MSDYWEKSFKEKQEMWGFEPAESTVLTAEFFKEKNIKNILIPGIGYGRNAQLFLDSGINVTGIEISKTAINLAQKHFEDKLLIHHGSATEMPFDQNKYDGIYAYALIHLLDKKERDKFILDCYNQLEDNGYMVFTMPTKKAPMYGQGTRVDKERFELFNGVKFFFYDMESIKNEFSKAGLIEVQEVNDIYPFYLIKCRKS